MSFHLLPNTNSIEMNIIAHIPLWVCIWFISSTYSELRFLGHEPNEHSISWTLHTVSTFSKQNICLYNLVGICSGLSLLCHKYRNTGRSDVKGSQWLCMLHNQKETSIESYSGKSDESLGEKELKGHLSRKAHLFSMYLV